MTRREHMGLRAFGLLLLAAAALWPRSRHAHHDPPIAADARGAEATAARTQVTTARARLSPDDAPRPRTTRVLVVDSTESELTN